MKDYFVSLTELILETEKYQPTKLDRLYAIIGSLESFADPNEITVDEIKQLQNRLYLDQILKPEEIKKGRKFYESSLQAYLRFTDKSGNLSNKRANSLRRIERKKLEAIIGTGEQ